MATDRIAGYAATALAGLALLGVTTLAVVAPAPASLSITRDAAVLDTGAATWTGGPDTDLSDTLSASWLLGDPVSNAITLPAPPTVAGPAAEAVVLDAGTGVSTPAGSANSPLSSLVSSMARLPMMAFRLLGSSAKEFAELPSALQHDLHDPVGPGDESGSAATGPDQLFASDPSLGGILPSDGGVHDGLGLDGLGLDGLGLDGLGLDAGAVDVAPVDVPTDLIPLP